MLHVIIGFIASTTSLFKMDYNCLKGEKIIICLVRTAPRYENEDIMEMKEEVWLIFCLLIPEITTYNRVRPEECLGLCQWPNQADADGILDASRDSVSTSIQRPSLLVVFPVESKLV